ncbi:O-antigen ligase [Pseudomonas peli]|uniref:O-antigen ligase n=1 Tax=Pseudomonas peli TaxID=592361 RepID=A0AB37Z5C9_9PSED|nr:O-antigen ligase family protein [Pseudomonas peli]NMZ68348.1 O-antigen ligase family protein [Pseudomonas peli]SCW46108.1 O-antigen ligase [Pseudomonas peli]
MKRIDFALNMLVLGFFWFLVGIAWAPSNKFYQQGLVLLLWLPVFVCMFVLRVQLLKAWLQQRVLSLLIGAFLIWACLSVFWSLSEDIGRELKRVFYVGLFLCAMTLLGLNRQQAIWKSLGFSFVLLVLAFPVSFYLYYIVGMHAFTERLWGIGQIGHPILGGYVIALAVVWGSRFYPKKWWARLLWALLMVMGVSFVAMGQSRGALLALVVGLCAMSLLSVERRYALLICALALGGVSMGFIFFEPILMARGTSYRLDIFLESLDMIVKNPVLGVGVGSDYRVVPYNFSAGFDHAHNSFTHTGIELGGVGFLLWVGVWLLAFFSAWSKRRTREGQLALGTLLVAVVALQFDTGSQWETPRAEWFVVWLPIGLVMALNARREKDSPAAMSPTVASCL